MHASALFRLLRRFVARFDVVLFDMRPRQADMPVRASVEPQPPVGTVVASVPPTASPPKKMRTLEEVRADLARLRLSARERHAQVHVWRDTNFAPTDFMDLANN